MSELASLGTRFVTEGAQATLQQLDAYAAKSKEAAQASDVVAGGTRRMSSSMQDMVESVRRAEREMAVVAQQERAVAQAADMAAASTRSLGLAASQATPALSKAGREAQVASVQLDHLHDTFQTNFAAQYVAQMGAVTTAHGRAAGSSKVLTQAGLNLSRQFADIGVTAAMGMSPLMILIQQGPQIADAFAMAKTQGLGFKDVLSGITKGAIGLLATWGPLIVVGGAVAGAFMLWRKHADDLRAAQERLAAVSKRVVEAQDAIISAYSSASSFAEKYEVSSANLDKAIDGVIQSQNSAYAATMTGISATDAAARAAQRRAEMERLLTVNLLRKAAAEADIRAKASEDDAKKNQQTANRAGMFAGVGAAISGAEFPGSVDPLSTGDRVRAQQAAALGVETAKRAAAADREHAKALRQLADETLRMKLVTPEAQKAREDAARSAERAANKSETEAERLAKRTAEELKRAKEATADYITGLERELQAIGRTSDGLRRLAADREAEKAIAQGDMDSAIRIKQLALEIGKYEELAKALEEVTKYRKSALEAARESITKMPTGVVLDEPDRLEELNAAFEEALRLADDLRYAVDDIYYSIRNNDWMGAFAGLFRVLDQLRTVLQSNASLATKIGAVGGVVAGVGGMIGGTTGSVISGIGSGAAAGAQLGSIIPGIGTVVGAGIGAVLGGITSFFGSSKAEKAKRNADALARAEQELAYARQVAAQRLDLDIQLMEAQGNAAGALAARRKAELAAMDASLRPLQELVWAEQELADARQKAVDQAQQAVDDARARLTEAYQAESSALERVIDRFQGFSDSLKKFLGTLYRGPAAMLSPEEQYRSARGEFDRVSGLAAGGDENAIRDLESVSQAYLDASRSYYASSKEYFQDLERVRAAVSATERYASTQVDLAVQQLNALNASVAGIIAVNGSVMSVHDALAAYQSAVLALAQAVAANQAAANDNPAPKGPDWDSYIANNADVAAEYARNMGSAKGRDYLASLGIGSASAFGQWHWNQYGKNEGRTPYAAGGIMDRPITLGESGIGAEAGPESIMPLANVGGKMGVHAVGQDNSEVVARLERIIAQNERQIAEMKADKVQRVGMDEAQAQRDGRIEDELDRLGRALSVKNAG